MAQSSFLMLWSSKSGGSFRLLSLIPTCLALFSSLSILLYIFNTSKLDVGSHHSSKPVIRLRSSTTLTPQILSPTHRQFWFINVSTKLVDRLPNQARFEDINGGGAYSGREKAPSEQSSHDHRHQFGSNGNYDNKKEVFHDREMFVKDYEEMVKSFKIYVYPHKKKDPFANALLPVTNEPGGNYASESYFKKALMKSHFITDDPRKADLFFMPFSIAGLRNDRRVSVAGIPDFVRDYISNVGRKYPYWNRTGGADHFYVACHSVGRSAMSKANEAKLSVIQVVCSSSYFLHGYIAHKDACLPQIWPRQVDPPNLASSERKRLAFFAGAMNSPVRQQVVRAWKNDPEIFVHSGRLKTPYADELLGSKFCLHVKGFEVNTARVGDSIFYGCVPVIIANYYDLPFADILNWNSFSVVIPDSDIPLLKKILKEISSDEYLKLQSNVLKVREHFKWHSSPIDYDAFYMVMYELWLRRSLVRVPFE